MAKTLEQTLQFFIPPRPQQSECHHDTWLVIEEVITIIASRTLFRIRRTVSPLEGTKILAETYPEVKPQ